MTGILPSYQRFVNGVPVPSISRRSFRLREKYLIVSVLLTFGIVWLGALFYLPEFKSSTSVNDSVYNVYKRIQKAGPELLMPPPLAQNDVGDFPVVGIARHGEEGDDPHIVEDRNRLRAKIDEDLGMKVLERPQFDVAPSVSSSKGPSKAPVDALEEPAVGNNAISKDASPSAPKAESSNKYVAVALSPDANPDVRHKLETVKEDDGAEPVRAAALRSYLARRVGSGYTLQRDPTRIGQFYVELRVYNSKEAETLAANRWKRALFTLRSSHDDGGPVWKALTGLVSAAKQEYANIKPILYPSNVF